MQNPPERQERAVHRASAPEPVRRFSVRVLWLQNMTLRDAVLPIVAGPLRGSRWMLATRSSFFLGRYEPEQTALFQQHVRPGDVVYDIGAHFGYYTLLASRQVGSRGSVICFEPSPSNLHKLRRHIEANTLTNVRIVELAVSDREGTAHFETRTGSGVGHLSETGPLEVRTTRLDSLAAELPAPNVMKIDVEGAEVAVLHGAADTLRRSRPKLFLSVHSEELKRTCKEILANLNYEIREILDMELLALPR